MKLKKIKNSFLNNTLLLTSGTIFAQGLNIILLPIITRIYPPEEYGIITIYISILIAISFLGSMNYEMAIPIADDDKKAVNILMLSIITLFIFTSLITIIIILFGNKILVMVNSEELASYKYLIPIGALFLGLYDIVIQWGYRDKSYLAITKTKISQSLSNNIFSIGLGLLKFGPLGLIIGRILGQSAGILPLFKSIIKNKGYLFKYIRKTEIIWAAKRYKNFPLYTTPRRFLGDISISLPILFIASLYGSNAVGLFGLAHSVVQLPMNLIGTSVSSVFYAESASLKNSNPHKIKELSNKLLKNLTLIGIIPVLILLFLGPTLFTLIFGDEWYEAGVYASLLSISVFSRLVFKPVSNIFDIFEKQKLALILNIFRLTLVVLVFVIAYYIKLNSFWTVGLYSFAMAIVYFVQYLLASSVLNKEIDIVDKSKVI